MRVFLFGSAQSLDASKSRSGILGTRIPARLVALALLSLLQLGFSPRLHADALQDKSDLFLVRKMASRPKAALPL
jgi:hypothetical protein